MAKTANANKLHDTETIVTRIRGVKLTVLTKPEPLQIVRLLH